MRKSKLVKMGLPSLAYFKWGGEERTSNTVDEKDAKRSENWGKALYPIAWFEGVGSQGMPLVIKRGGTDCGPETN